MAKAELIFEDRQLLPDNAIIEMRIWLVAAPVPPSRHAFKYALFHGRVGQRIVLFDNERGKGDHCHIHQVERPYRFVSPEQLVADFMAAVRAAREEGPQ